MVASDPFKGYLPFFAGQKVRFARRIGTDEDEGHAGKDGDQAVEQEDPSPAGKRCYGDEADAIAEQPAEDTAQSVGAVPDSEAERLFVSLDGQA